MQRLTFDPLKNLSLAVHVSQIGFHPEDPAKVAFITPWPVTHTPGDISPASKPDSLIFGILRRLWQLLGILEVPWDWRDAGMLQLWGRIVLVVLCAP